MTIANTANEVSLINSYNRVNSYKSNSSDQKIESLKKDENESFKTNSFDDVLELSDEGQNSLAQFQFDSFKEDLTADQSLSADELNASHSLASLSALDSGSIEGIRNRFKSIDFNQIQNDIKKQLTEQLLLKQLSDQGQKFDLKLPDGWQTLKAEDLYYAVAPERGENVDPLNSTDSVSPNDAISGLEGLDPYWNAENTSQRIVDFAMSFKGMTTNTGEDFFEVMKQAVLSGFSQAKEIMGELPGPSAKLYNDTLKLTMDKFDKLSQNNEGDSSQSIENAPLVTNSKMNQVAQKYQSVSQSLPNDRNYSDVA